MEKVWEISGDFLFSEEQRFPRWVALLMISPLMVVLGVAVLVELSETDRRELVIALAIIIPLQLVLCYMFFSTRFEKAVTSNGLYYRWLPLQKKYRRLGKEEIVSAEVRKSPALKYGAGLVPGYGRVHNAGSGKGLQLVLGRRKKMFFSANDVDGFLRAVTTLSGNSKEQAYGRFS